MIICVALNRNAKQMPKDVREAIERLIATHGGLNPVGATEYMRKLERARRYVVETW
jgi:sulfite reductase alpha subunit-like flavoprotein